jgi:hypothetical protein
LVGWRVAKQHRADLTSLPESLINRVHTPHHPHSTFDIHPTSTSSLTSYVFSSLDKLSMANVMPGDDRLFVHLFSVYVITFIVMRVRARGGAGRPDDNCSLAVLPLLV